MSTAIASKNLYELLGNTEDQNPDRAPEAPVKVIDKPVQRSGKRNAPEPAADPLRPSAGGRGARDAGAVNNREQGDRPARNREPREYRGGEGRGEGRGRGRGRGRAGRGGAPRDDRHSHTGINEHEKQAAHGWGAETGTAEWADEKAGQAIANAEANNDSGFTPDTGAADPAFSNGPGAAGEAVNDEAAAEPEDNTKSYDQYLAEQAEKRLAISQTLSVRKANEGSKQQFPEGKAFSRESEDFIAAATGKARKAKEAQDKKERLTLDGQYYQAADSGDRGGRGGRGGRGVPRGGRGGESRGERGSRGGRGRGEPRGGARGESRPERGSARGAFNATDASAFPALGGS